MKTIRWTDKKGFKRVRMIKDDDPEEMAIYGKPLEPPDIERLDWKRLKAKLHNELLVRGLLCWRNVQHSQNGVTSAILSTFRKEIVELYKEEV